MPSLQAVSHFHNMDILQALLLGIVQGLTEWLPVSSSGHLVLAQHLMNLSVPVSFDVWLHVATLGAVLLFFRKEIGNITAAFFTFDRKNPLFTQALLLILATFTTALVVFPLQEIFEETFSSLILLAIGFFITAALLLLSRNASGKKPMNAAAASVVGIMQGISFLPSISRSGATISTALLMGVEREKAFTFSFLLSIPAILGAAVLKAGELEASTISPEILAASFAASFLAGFATLFVLKKLVLNRKFHYFAWYCIFIGIATLIIAFT